MNKYLRCRKCTTFSVVLLGFHSWKFCTGQSDLNIYNRFEMVKFRNENIWNPCETLNRYRVWKTTFASILGFHVWFSGCCPWTKIILMLNLKRGSNFAFGRPQFFLQARLAFIDPRYIGQWEGRMSQIWTRGSWPGSDLLLTLGIYEKQMMISQKWRTLIEMLKDSRALKLCPHQFSRIMISPWLSATFFFLVGKKSVIVLMSQSPWEIWDKAHLIAACCWAVWGILLSRHGRWKTPFSPKNTCPWANWGTVGRFFSHPENDESLWLIPSGYVKIAIENGPVEIADLPMNSMVVFHGHVNVYQRVDECGEYPLNL